MTYTRMEETAVVLVRHRIEIRPGMSVANLMADLALCPQFAVLRELPSQGPDFAIIDFIESTSVK